MKLISVRMLWRICVTVRGVAALAILAALAKELAHRDHAIVMLPREPEITPAEIDSFPACLAAKCGSELEAARKAFGVKDAHLLTDEYLRAAFAADGSLPRLPKGHSTRALQHCRKALCPRARICAEMAKGVATHRPSPICR